MSSTTQQDNSGRIRFFTFEQFHNRKNTGSTKIRVHNLLKHWPEAKIYQYAEKPDVMIFQKVYAQPDYDFPKTLDCIKILDICDPDWLEDMPIKETVDAMDAVVVPTEDLKQFICQLTDKPVRVIKDRFDLTEFPATPKIHEGRAKEIVWFGYVHNVQTVKSALHAIIELDLRLTIISNKNPNLLATAEGDKLKKENYNFVDFDPLTVNYEISKNDICILPKGLRPIDRFKSENKEIISQLCGVPVAKTREELEALLEAEARNSAINKVYGNIKEEYDCKKSVAEYKELIDELKASR